jgi:hypothetical protein
MDNDTCFSPQALALLGILGGLIQGAVIFLFRGWVGSLKDQISACQAEIGQARLERDRAMDGWEATIGLGEKAVRRERRRP